MLAIGISAMNNYDKMNSVQSSIETLSKSVQGSSENTVTAEEDAAADQQEEQPDGAVAL